VHHLYFHPSTPEALHVKRHESPLVVRNGNGREMADKFGRETRLSRNFQGSLTCRKSATWDRRLYFPSEGRRAENFFARKIRRFRPGSNPRSWVPEARTLTTRPPKPLRNIWDCSLLQFRHVVVKSVLEFTN